jgi:hypothetical protein
MSPRHSRFPGHGLAGLLLIAVFWPLNWGLDGARTHWGFFPLWLGYCLLVDALARRRSGTSLLTRGGWRYAALFAVSVPLWWIFEAINQRTGNWIYLGGEHLSDLEYAWWASLCFSTVVPAVLGTAEWIAGFGWVRRFRDGPRFPGGPVARRLLFACGLVMFGALMAWPELFFPFVWLSLFFLIDPINAARGRRSILALAARGDWRPVIGLCGGVLVCGFFWEMWNVASWPKWVYSIPYLEFGHVFEMPAFGYLGYPPFALEVFAITHLLFGIFGRGRSDYVVRGLAPGA